MKKVIYLSAFGLFLFIGNAFSFNSNFGESGVMPWTKLKIIEVDNLMAEGGLPARVAFQFLRESTNTVVYTGYIEVNTNKELLAMLLTAYTNDYGVAIEWANDNGNLDSSKLRFRK